MGRDWFQRLRAPVGLPQDPEPPPQIDPAAAGGQSFALSPHEPFYNLCALAIGRSRPVGLAETLAQLQPVLADGAIGQIGQKYAT
jgi:hypothetical protein